MKAPDALLDQAAKRRWLWQGPDYGWLLPTLARLPERLGYALSGLRGWLNRRWGRDWAELSVGQRYIGERTAAAYRTLFPGAAPEAIAGWVLTRYQTVAAEELEGQRIARDVLDVFAAGQPDLSGCMTRLSGLGSGGLVVVQAHFNNPLVGCMGLARATGRRVWVTISAVTDHPQVHPAVSMHFKRKYAQAQASLNGGGFQETESPAGLRRLYRALKAGDLVVVMADLPAAPGQDGVCVPWLGQHRVMAAGAVRLARQTGCALAAMVVTCPANPSNGQWQWALSEPLLPQPGVPDGADEAVASAYGALGEAIRRHPGQWWAAHLLHDAACCEGGGGDMHAPKPAALRQTPDGVQPSSGWPGERLEKGGAKMTLDWVVIRASSPPDAGDAQFGLRALQTLWSAQTRVLVGMDWAQALALLPADAEGQMLVLDGAWLSVDRRCLEHLDWALGQGADVAQACDSAQPTPMRPVAYATLRGMERFVNLHPLAVHPVDGATSTAKFELGSVAGWRKRQAGDAKVVRVSGAWVHDSSGFFSSAREEMLPLVPPDVCSAVDVGGGEGGFLSALKAKQPQVKTQLVELTEGAAAQARGRVGVDAVWVGDFQTWAPAQRFDCISFLDVIEHMVDPELALRHARSLLTEEGCVVMSIPNVGHWSVVADLLEGRWDWAPSGIHCYTHVRFFTRQSIEDMLARVGLRAVEWMPVVVPGPTEWLDAWRQSTGLAVDADALNVYAYGVRAVASGD